MEIVADSVVFNRVSSSDTYTKVTHDGGKRWNTLEGENRQVDDHALWIDPQVAGHLLIAGGVIMRAMMGATIGSLRKICR